VYELTNFKFRFQCKKFLALPGSVGWLNNACYARQRFKLRFAKVILMGSVGLLDWTPIM